MPETRAMRDARRRVTRSPEGGRRSATPGARGPSSTASARRSRTGSPSLVHVGRGRARGQLSPSPSPPPRLMGQGSRSPTGSRASARGGRRTRSRSRRDRTPSRQRSRGSPARRGMRSPTLYRQPSQRRPGTTRSPSARTLKRKLLEVETIKKKLEKMENKKKEKEWSNSGIKKQAEFAIGIREYHEELNVRLEMEYGPVSDSLQEFIKQGESKVHNRIHLLKVADKYGWAGATDFQEEELARDEKEEKKLKAIRKDFEARNKRNQGGSMYKNTSYANYRDEGTDNNKDTRKQENVSSKDCYECGKAGHLARDCRSKRGGGEERAKGGETRGRRRW